MQNAFDSENYPRREPATLVRGVRWAWRRDDLLSTYPAASYSWRWVARPESGVTAGQGEISIAGSASGSAVLFEVAAATTATYKAGRYRWELRITRTSDSEVVPEDAGVLLVEPDTDATTDDRRSWARRSLEMLEQALAGNTQPEVLSYSIGGRTIARMSAEERIRWYGFLRHKVAAEDRAALAAAGRPTGMRVRARFRA